jgi:hypothetical protein
VGAKSGMPDVSAPPAASAAVSLPLMTIVALHFLQRIFTILPTTFSSAIVYFAAHDWHEIFIA